MAKPMVPSVSDSYGKTHGMEKPIGVFMAKPIGPKITTFNDGGRYHKNSSQITNPLLAPQSGALRITPLRDFHPNPYLIQSLPLIAFEHLSLYTVF